MMIRGTKISSKIQRAFTDLSELESANQDLDQSIVGAIFFRQQWLLPDFCQLIIDRHCQHTWKVKAVEI